MDKEEHLTAHHTGGLPSISFIPSLVIEQQNLPVADLKPRVVLIKDITKNLIRCIWYSYAKPLERLSF